MTLQIAPANISIGQKAIVTTDNFFFAPDGREYKAVFGTIHGVDTAEESLGVKPNGRSTNWYLRIGSMVIAGCQVHYVLRTDTCSFDPIVAWNWHEGRAVEAHRPTSIYNAEVQT